MWRTKSRANRPGNTSFGENAEGWTMNTSSTLLLSRGGGQVVYNYRDMGMPLYFMTTYAKNERENLSQAEINTLQKVTRLLASTLFAIGSKAGGFLKDRRVPTCWSLTANRKPCRRRCALPERCANRPSVPLPVLR